MQDIAATILPLVRETRDILLPHYGISAVKEKKSDSAHDVVTQLDHDVERFLADRLKLLDPESEFTGEEFGGATSSKPFWICDPIDGTAHFVRGMPFCTTMLARIEEGQVTFSVIYDFVNDLMYHAEKGRGAFRNGESISVSDRPMKDAYISYETHLDKQENLDRFVKLRSAANLIKFMNCGFEFAMVASGKFEGRVSFDPWGHDWDYAPGSLLVSEAGGVVANLGATTYDYRNHDFIAANPSVFRALTDGPNSIFPLEQ